MNALVLILISIIAFSIAYVTYGSWLTKQWGVDDTKATPAHTRPDGVDYVPASAPVLLGHHFASIAGAGPIVGPIAAAIFGWVPVLLWIIVGSIFFGGVQDYSSLFASIRHEGKSIGEVIHVNMGTKGKQMFSIFAWLTLLLVVAAFTNIVANTFVAVPAAGTASLLFIVLAIGFGYAIYRKGVSLTLGSVVGVALWWLPSPWGICSRWR
jgi:carbon starvation protein